MSFLIPDDLAELFEGGVSILVGTRDASLRPEATRGAGAVVHPDRRRLTVFLPVDVSARAAANLRDNGRLSVGFSSVLDARTLQVKGRLEELRECNEAEREVINRYHAAYAEILYLAGLPRALSRRMNVWPSLSVTFAVTDIFLQTPGPNAGARLGAGV
jgi:hypothetical protein